MNRFRIASLAVLSLTLMAPALAQDTPKAKNIILFIGDGRGINHIEAANFFQHGEAGKQLYQQTFKTLYMSTYSVEGGYDPQAAWNDPGYIKKKTTDSAAAGTALATGVKTYNGAIGLGPDRQPRKSIVDLAEEQGRSTGVVTSVPLSHATPAAFAAHADKRSSYAAISSEMFTKSKLEVIMGTGNPWFDTDGKLVAKVDEKGVISSEQPTDYVGGPEVWLGLHSETLASDSDGDGQPDAWSLATSRDDFQRLATGETPKRVAGIAPVSSTLQQERSGDANAAAGAVPFTQTVPTLAEMTKAALNVLDNNPKGFFVMVEGGAVDWAGHDNQAGRVIEESMDLDRAIEAAVEWVEKNSNWDETLVIITADHETGGISGPGESGFIEPVTGNGAGQMPNMKFMGKSHTNSLVPVYAKGPGTSLIEQYADETDPKRGPYLDNTEVAKAMFAVFGGEPGAHASGEVNVAPTTEGGSGEK
ncbi:MAG: alkaline phosphatase [FCB group bacterium]|jgi:alkaline phosphatase|nr:alkaline phosphatase [FCB group bacterium]